VPGSTKTLLSSIKTSTFSGAAAGTWVLFTLLACTRHFAGLAWVRALIRGMRNILREEWENKVFRINQPIANVAIYVKDIQIR